jgi:mannitol/fructose-specific phosphotransferase system IIA component (Ntr-type)
LFVPQSTTKEHLDMLARLAEGFSDAAFVDRLRQLTSAETIYSLLAGV